MTATDIRALVTDLTHDERALLVGAVRGRRIRMGRWNARLIYSLIRKKLLIASLVGSPQLYTRYDPPALVEEVLQKMYPRT